MFRNTWFQLHWFIGLTAGIVLALVGLTGAMLSYEQPLLRALNPGVIRVAPSGEASLTPDQLLARVQATTPGKRIVAITVASDPGSAVRINFAAGSAAAPWGPGGKPRGESRYADPVTGALLGKPRGEGFFRAVMQIHRWLAADKVGKQIVGASTLALVFLALSGLYLRWPRRIGDWRAWLTLDWARRGRIFLWHLHTVVGTWVLLLYLLMAITGLTWSYPAFRDALAQHAGVPARNEGAPAMRGERRDDTAVAAGTTIDLARAWQVFTRSVDGYSTATLRLPERAGQALEISYLDVDPAHERASNVLKIDGSDYRVLEHRRYADKPLAQQLFASLLPLHSGSFFGWVGSLAFMLASLCMPLFAITGWMLYLDRRKRKQARKARRPPA